MTGRRGDDFAAVLQTCEIPKERGYDRHVLPLLRGGD
jgi:hypothetical protein